MKIIHSCAILLLCVILLTGCQSGTRTAEPETGQLTLETAIVQSPVESPAQSEAGVSTEAAPASSPTPGPTWTPLPPPSAPLHGMELNKIDSASIELALNASTHWIRRNSLKWSLVEENEGQRNWGALVTLENEMLTAAARGTQLVLVINGTPGWAQQYPGYFCGPIAADKLSVFAQFMYEVVARYSAPPFNVKYWELWNEPDIEPSLVAEDSPYGCWGDRADIFYGGGYFTEMLKQVYPQIKAADPGSQVLVGGLLMDCDPINPPEGKDCQSSLFMEGILRSGGGEFFDGISFHAYDYYSGPSQYYNPNWHSNRETTGPVLIAKARYIRSLLASYQQAGKFLMNTEAGLLCGSSEDSPDCQSKEFGLSKAAYAVESYVSALSEGLRANIWYSLEGWRGTGLVDAQDQPVPAYEAFRINASQLFNASYVRLVNEIPGVRGYELQRNLSRLYVLWSVDGSEHSYEFAEAPIAVYNTFGEQIQPGAKITIGNQPLYLEW